MRSSRLALAPLAALVALSTVTSRAHAQFIKGVVRDAETKGVVANAFVALLDTTAATVYAVTTDARGRYALQVPAAGTYAILAYKDGYQRQTSDWLQLSTSDSVEVTSHLARLVTTLTPVLIEAEREEIRTQQLFGMALKTIGGTIMTRSEVAQVAARSTDVYDVVSSLHVQALQIRTVHLTEPQKGIAPGIYQCVSYGRSGGCLMVVVDGMRLTNLTDLLQLDNFIARSNIDYMIFLRPNEAGVLFGDGSQNGVLVIKTKGQGKD